MGAGEHAIALFCIEYGCVPRFLHSDTFTLYFEVELCTLMNV